MILDWILTEGGKAYKEYYWFTWQFWNMDDQLDISIISNVEFAEAHHCTKIKRISLLLRRDKCNLCSNGSEKQLCVCVYLYSVEGCRGSVQVIKLKG